MTPAFEAGISGRIRKALAQYGCVSRKLHGTVFAVTGDPDIYGCAEHGRMFQLETKQPGKRARTIQRKRLREWQKGGAIVGVVTSPDDAVAIVIDHMPICRECFEVVRTPGTYPLCKRCAG